LAKIKTQLFLMFMPITLFSNAKKGVIIT